MQHIKAPRGYMCPGKLCSKCGGRGVVGRIVDIRRRGQGEDVAAYHLEHTDAPQRVGVDFLIGCVDVEDDAACELVKGIDIELCDILMVLERVEHFDNSVCDVGAGDFYSHRAPPSSLRVMLRVAPSRWISKVLPRRATVTRSRALQISSASSGAWS